MITDGLASMGDRIKARRKSLGMTQDKLAQLTGITQAQISRYEMGQSDPTSGYLLAIADVLEVSVDWLLGRVDYPPDLPMHYGELNEIEQEALRVFRTKAPDRRSNIIAILRLLS